MDIEEPSKAMALCPQTKWTRENRHDKKPNNASSEKCIRSAKLGSPSEIHACSSRISSEIYMD